MDDESVLHRLDTIRKSASDVKARIDEVLERDDKIGIATLDIDAYAEDLYGLMRSMANAANPVLKEMGLNREAITTDIEKYVRILEDNEGEYYFASINLDAKYLKKKHALENLRSWLARLNESIDRITGYLESETEKRELKNLFAMVEGTALSKGEKEGLKKEFTKVLNRLNRS